jgi:5'-deoxynucleotidase
MQKAFKEVEVQAERELLSLLPDYMQSDFETLLVSSSVPDYVKKLIKGADTISAYLKCQAELKAGNSEFSKAAEDIAARLQGFNMPEGEEFLSVFVPSYQLTLDELLNGSEKIRNLPLQNK